ncbi:peroxiredoxin family protein [Falsibacillus albus]|uniref:TlpA family protein disulfide reductase n=1 Tax=Falsibacillus albus TaxID=2478915 RepID=A0A3L7K1S9_9BACI|nr:TlpA disulfide reductase family protein [Falsibacillus albus]RLQ96750.1 TlpA family protein disulfide reductase [Falsibacillus albus]
MNKRIFSLLVVGLLMGILVFNLIDKTSQKRNSNEQGIELADGQGSADTGDSGGLKKGSKAPDFRLQTIDGKFANLSDFKGKKVILNFWATWCPPCQAEIPHMVKFYNEKAEKLNFQIVAVNLTSLDKGQDKVKSFVKDYHMPFPVLLDAKGEIGKEYGAFAIPTSYILDEKGIIQEKIVGPMDEEMMQKLLTNQQ